MTNVEGHPLAFPALRQFDEAKTLKIDFHEVVMSVSALEAAKAARLARQEAGIKVVVKNPSEKLATNPKSMRLSINAMCWDCQGAGLDPGTKQAIGDCTFKDCGLYQVRPYQKRAV